MKLEIENIVKTYRPNYEADFLLGFLAACDLFTTWKNGNQYIGESGFSLKDIRKWVREYQDND